MPGISANHKKWIYCFAELVNVGILILSDVPQTRIIVQHQAKPFKRIILETIFILATC